MLVNGTPHRTVWLKPDEPQVVQIIDQRQLPWKFEVVELRTVSEVAVAIKDMWVRGAGCIGATAGYGMWLATLEAMRDPNFVLGARMGARKLLQTRPTAVNLAYAVDRMMHAVQRARTEEQALQFSHSEAVAIAEEDVASCKAIGDHGLSVLKGIAQKKKPGETLNILTHCNAGWLAFVDIGSATAPIYAATPPAFPFMCGG